MSRQNEAAARIITAAFAIDCKRSGVKMGIAYF